MSESHLLKGLPPHVLYQLQQQSKLDPQVVPLYEGRRVDRVFAIHQLPLEIAVFPIALLFVRRQDLYTRATLQWNNLQTGLKVWEQVFEQP